MERLGKTLKDHMDMRSGGFSLKTVCQVGIQLIQVLECLHEIGYVYNDLKLDNILIGVANEDNNHQ